METRLSVSMKLPDVDSVVLCCRDNHTIVEWVENCINQWIGVPNEGLEKVGYALLSIIIPNFQEVVLSSRKHVATVKREVSASDSTFMYGTEFSEVGTFESGQAVDSNTLVFCYNDDLTIVLRELEAANHVTDRNLMLQDD